MGIPSVYSSMCLPEPLLVLCRSWFVVGEGRGACQQTPELRKQNVRFHLRAIQRRGSNAADQREGTKVHRTFAVVLEPLVRRLRHACDCRNSLLCQLTAGFRRERIGTHSGLPFPGVTISCGAPRTALLKATPSSKGSNLSLARARSCSIASSGTS